MSDPRIFTFHQIAQHLSVPASLNNPFNSAPPQIMKEVAKMFQEFLSNQKWEKDLMETKGKMFGVLLVRKSDGNLAFLAAVSGKLPTDTICHELVPSVFDESTDNFFINRGMSELTAIGDQIKSSSVEDDIEALKQLRSVKSNALQEKLFEHYCFLNLSAQTKSVRKIFLDADMGRPPAATGECAAPKLLNYALANKLEPIGLAEFWWGKSPKGQGRKHRQFYPACKEKCRPLLEFMLENKRLYDSAKLY